MMQKIKTIIPLILFLVLCAAGVIWTGAHRYALSVPDFINLAARVSLNNALMVVYRADLKYVDETTSQYYVGYDGKNGVPDWTASWTAFEKKGAVRVSGATPLKPVITRRDLPFVSTAYPDPVLNQFKTRYALGKLIEHHPTEFEQMLAVSRWVGNLWDHGLSELPENPKTMALHSLVEAGRKGQKFWCEVCAITTVKTALSLGWDARLITLSQDGYTWEHAVAELWSNQFNKWFLIDTDFNVIFMSSGIPLSSYEMCHQGYELQKQNRLQAVHFTGPKPSLPLIDLLPYFNYVHIDMRNDWDSRKLRRGSPAGGDKSTWWTARPSLGPVLTSGRFIGQNNVFDWKVNNVEIFLNSLEPSGQELVLQIGFYAYSPGYQQWQMQMDGGEWVSHKEHIVELKLSKGEHILKARILLKNGQTGPISGISFDI